METTPETDRTLKYNFFMLQKLQILKFWRIKPWLCHSNALSKMGFLICLKVPLLLNVFSFTENCNFSNLGTSIKVFIEKPLCFFKKKGKSKT